MADHDSSAPLIISYSNDAIHRYRSPSLDETIESCIGDFSLSQFFQSLLVSVAWIFDAQQTFISVFTDAAPGWHCTTNDDQSLCRVTNSTMLCNIPRDSWVWDYSPVRTSIVSEWDLQCATSSFITGLPASAFFVGCLTGGLLFATLADSSFGRKNMLLLSCFIMSITSLLTALAPSLWIYSLLRFLCGVGRATVGTCAIVLSSELVGRRWRGQVGVLGFLCFSLGFLSLPAIAYLNVGTSWRNLYLWTSIPTLFYCLVVKLAVHESPRWLFLKGSRDEAIATLNALIPKYKPLISITDEIYETGMIASQENGDNIQANADLLSSIKMLFVEKRWVLKRLVAIMISAFGIGMLYYGMPLGLPTLPFNLYLSVTLNALAELPAFLVIFFLIDKLNRRTTLLCCTMISGVTSIVSVAVAAGGAVQIGLEMISFFCSCTSLNMILIYTLELFPTCVRNSAMSMVRQALVLGGAFSPMLVAAGREDHGILSFGVFGLVMSCCGLFVALLPETRDGRLCDTFEEEENKHLIVSDANYLKVEC